MRIMTFNLRTSYAYGDGPNLWDKRRDFAAETIRDINPDLCGLQEMDPGMWKDLEERLSGWQILKGQAQGGERPNGNGLLIREGAFEIMETGRFWLSSTPDRESISFPHDWGPRIVFWARLHPSKTTRAVPSPSGRGEGEGGFLVGVTHFDTHKDSWLPAAKIARDELAKAAGGLPVILMGDFNSDAGGPAWSLLKEAGYKDAWLEAGGSAGPSNFTYHAFTGRDDEAFGRIDWILHQGPWKAWTCVIDKRNREGVYPSDHFPVYADYEKI